jgi:hypothetical protein
MTRLCAAGIVLALSLAIPGCGFLGEPLETAYGRVRGQSINGTGALAEVFRQRGHTVRVAAQVNERVGNWAALIVRFAPYPGPPEKKEADWYLEWLGGNRHRRLIYVARDFDSQEEYWDGVIAQLPASVSNRTRERYQEQRSLQRNWSGSATARPKEIASDEDWFATKPPSKAAAVCKALSGPWALGVDAKAAKVARHETFIVNAETPLLEGDDEVLAMDWTNFNGAEVLAVANGSFLLNEPLAHRERRPLAMRVVQWAGNEPQNVVFVEGRSPTEARAGPASVFDLLWIDPLGWVGFHLIAFGVLACLSMAVRLGRARGEPTAGADRPVAHAEALGDLLARTRNEAGARGLLDAYNRWRHPTSHHPAAARSASHEPASDHSKLAQSATPEDPR